MKTLVIVSIAALITGGTYSTIAVSAETPHHAVIQVAEAQTEETGLWNRMRNMFRKEEKQQTAAQAQGTDSAKKTQEQARTRNTERAAAAGDSQAKQTQQQTREQARVRQETASGKQAGAQEQARQRVEQQKQGAESAMQSQGGRAKASMDDMGKGKGSGSRMAGDGRGGGGGGGRR